MSFIQDPNYLNNVVCKIHDPGKRLTHTLCPLDLYVDLKLNKSLDCSKVFDDVNLDSKLRLNNVAILIRKTETIENKHIDSFKEMFMKLKTWDIVDDDELSNALNKLGITIPRPSNMVEIYDDDNTLIDVISTVNSHIILGNKFVCTKAKTTNIFAADIPVDTDVDFVYYWPLGDYDNKNCSLDACCVKNIYINPPSSLQTLYYNKAVNYMYQIVHLNSMSSNNSIVLPIQIFMQKNALDNIAAMFTHMFSTLSFIGMNNDAFMNTIHSPVISNMKIKDKLHSVKDELVAKRLIDENLFKDCMYNVLNIIARGASIEVQSSDNPDLIYRYKFLMLLVDLKTPDYDMFEKTNAMTADDIKVEASQYLSQKSCSVDLCLYTNAVNGLLKVFNIDNLINVHERGIINAFYDIIIEIIQNPANENQNIVYLYVYLIQLSMCDKGTFKYRSVAYTNTIAKRLNKNTKRVTLNGVSFVILYKHEIDDCSLLLDKITNEKYYAYDGPECSHLVPLNYKPLSLKIRELIIRQQQPMLKTILNYINSCDEVYTTGYPCIFTDQMNNIVTIVYLPNHENDSYNKSAKEIYHTTISMHERSKAIIKTIADDDYILAPLKRATGQHKCGFRTISNVPLFQF